MLKPGAYAAYATRLAAVRSRKSPILAKKVSSSLAFQPMERPREGMVMLSRMMLKTLGMCGIPLAALLLMPGAVQAQQGCNDCQRFHCPPALKHWMEGSPHIHFFRGCPKPICNPCLNPNWGYFEPSWNPWPGPPGLSHGRVPPPAASVTLNPSAGTVVPQQGFIVPEHPTQPTPTLPPPRTLRPGL
jgi:hypothetical protein